jgi:membrane fusion protein (multidrug efflux system)
VQVTDVVQKDVPLHQQWTGSLDGFVNAEIHPQVQGYVVKQVYREGSYVHEGDLLFDIDARQFRAVATQQYGNLNRLIAALNKARLDVARDKKLIVSAAISQQQYDNDLAALREAEAAVVQARGTLDTAQLNQEWARVTSPISGVAGIARQQVGDLVSTTTVMTTVSQVDPIKANFNISEREYLHFAEQRRSAAPGQDPTPELELILDDGSLYPHRGKVIVADRQVNLTTGTMTIEGSFPNPGNLLRPGQYAKVRAVVETRKGALLVPQRAVTELQGTYQVGLVGADSKVDIRVVQTGPEFGSLLIVDKGLNVGDKVIVSDLARLRPGMTVHATPAPTVAGEP